MTTLSAEDGALVLQSPYDARLVAMIKSLPASERKFDPTRKAWLIAPQHGQAVAGWVAQYLGEMVFVPQINVQRHPELRILEVRYIGTCKERAPGEFSAFGWCMGEWSVIFPETVLKLWFEGIASSSGNTQSSTLFGVLGINQNANDVEIKAGYRRMAKQWHPDVCKEPDAEERFKRINEAYQVLGDPEKRERYCAGLILEASLVLLDADVKYIPGYRSPLRCGLILAEGVEELGRFGITKIVSWEDITDSRGRTLVTSWVMGAQMFTESWV